jgi:hypothetical protein
VIRCLALLLLTAVTLPAQRNEFSLQFGGTLTQRRSILLPGELQNLLGTDVLRENNGIAGGLVYRVRLISLGPLASISAEFPIFVVQATNTDLIPRLARPIFGNTRGVVGFFTPGGVVRLAPDFIVSPYVFVGGGYARVIEAQLTSLAPLLGRFGNQGTWAINYGGGADLRVVKFLAIRGEIRNFYTGDTGSFLPVAIPTVESFRQRNTLLITGGLVFRF